MRRRMIVVAMIGTIVLTLPCGIGDESDGASLSMAAPQVNFQRFFITVPNGGEKWYTGATNTIRWASETASN